MQQVGATLHRGARASHRHGLSCCGAQALERRLSSCGAWAQLLRGMWDLPRPGLEPVSPALAGRFSTTAPPRKPGDHTLSALVYSRHSRPFNYHFMCHQLLGYLREEGCPMLLMAMAIVIAGSTAALHLIDGLWRVVAIVNH